MNFLTELYSGCVLENALHRLSWRSVFEELSLISPLKNFLQQHSWKKSLQKSSSRQLSNNSLWNLLGAFCLELSWTICFKNYLWEVSRRTPLKNPVTGVPHVTHMIPWFEKKSPSLYIYVCFRNRCVWFCIRKGVIHRGGQIQLAFIGFRRVFSDVIGFHWISLKFVGCRWISWNFSLFCQMYLELVGIRWISMDFDGIRRHPAD